MHNFETQRLHSTACIVGKPVCLHATSVATCINNLNHTELYSNFNNHYPSRNLKIVGACSYTKPEKEVTS